MGILYPLGIPAWQVQVVSTGNALARCSLLPRPRKALFSSPIDQSASTLVPLDPMSAGWRSLMSARPPEYQQSWKLTRVL